MKRYVLFLLTILCGGLLPSVAQHTAQPLRLAPIFGSGMVLQCERPVCLWGQAPRGTRVQVSLIGTPTAILRRHTEGKRAKHGVPVTSLTADTVAAKDGTFRLHLPALKAGGPYTLQVSAGTERLVLDSLWVGEVWLCSGQSNMAMPVRDTYTAQADTAMAGRLTRLHFYLMQPRFIPERGAWGTARADSVDRDLYFAPARWTPCDARTAAGFSAIGFHFARFLSDSLDRHVGIICQAVDGSPIESWLPADSLSVARPDMAEGVWTDNRHFSPWPRERAADNLSALRGGASRHEHPYAPGYLYRTAVTPLAGYALRGVLWYQGESNGDRGKEYLSLFPMLERSWRSTLHDARLPFYTVQLSSLKGRPTWPAFRDVQRRLANELPHTYLTVSSDMGDSTHIHPRQKLVIARRLALQALYHTYGRPIRLADSPVPDTVTVDRDGSITFRFDTAGGLRCFTGMPDPALFEIEGTVPGLWFPATRIVVSPTNVTVRSPRVVRPQRVRYAWKDYYQGGLYNHYGLPLGTFELDLDTRRTHNNLKQ